MSTELSGLEANPVPYLRDCFAVGGHGRLTRGIRECGVSVASVKVKRQPEGYPTLVIYRVTLADGTRGSISCRKYAQFVAGRPAPEGS